MDDKNNINYTTENSLFFTIARMNPPTPGHMFLIQKLIEEALKRNVHKVYVILSKSNSDNENPINCKDKIDVLGKNLDDLTSMTNSLKENMIKNNSNMFDTEKIKSMQVSFVCVGEKENTPIQTVGRILYFDYKNVNDINMFVIIGEDRQNMADSLVDIFYEKNPNIKTIDTLILMRESMKKFKNLTKQEIEVTDMKTVPVDAFSASFIRKIVDYDLEDEFFEIYRPFLKDDNKIRNLYNLIKTGLSKPPPKSKVERINPLKYSYPLIKKKTSTRRYVEETPSTKKQRKRGGTRSRIKRRKTVRRRRRRQREKKY